MSRTKSFNSDRIEVPSKVNLYKQARKSSEDAQAAGYARFEKVLGQVRFGSKMFRLKILAFLHTFVLISGNPSKTKNICINFLTELDDFKKIDFGFCSIF